MSTTTIGEYEIRYVSSGDIIDPDNYNKLADAIFWLKNEITTMAWNHLQRFFKPERYTTYEGIQSYLSPYQKKYDEGLYHAIFLAPVYPYHHIDLKEVITSLIGFEWHLADWMAEDGFPVSDEIYSEISSALDLARSYPSFRKGDIVEPEHFNIVVNLVQEAYNIYEKLKAASIRIIYLLNTGDWNKAKTLITDGSAIFIGYSISGVYGSDIKPYLDNYKCVVVNLIDSEATSNTPWPTFYDILYITSTPTTYGYGPYQVTHKCFQAAIGSEFIAPGDDAPYHGDKRSDAVAYAHSSPKPTCTWCYVAHNAGYVVEVPFNESLRDYQNFKKFMDAINNCLIPNINRIIYLANYTVIVTGGNAADTLVEFARKYAWTIIDLR